MDKDINKNLTPEQAQGIEKQDVTKGIVDVDILEQSPSQIPEQQPSGTLASTLANAETVNEQAQEDRTKRELAEAERIKQQEKVNEQELLTRTLGQETLGQGEAEQEAIANSSIGTAQAEIDSLDQAILASSKALKAAEVQDALDVKKISTNSRGVPASIVRGQQAILAAERRAERNLQAIDLENDIATSALLQGKVDNAQKAIERAIKLKFDDKKAELKLEKEWLARSDRDLSEAKAKELREVEKEEAEAQSVFDIAAQARQAGAGQKEINAILNAETREEALAAAGSLGRAARLSEQIQRQTIAKNNIAMQVARAKKLQDSAPEQAEAKRQASKSTLDLVSGMIGNKLGFIESVGTNRFGRTGFFNTLSGGKQDKFIANAKTLTAKDTLNSLIDVKAQGATFGALSDGERQLVAQAANSLAGFAIYDDKGNPTGKFKGGESDVLEAMQVIQQSAAKSYFRNGGTVTPELKPIADSLANEYVEEVDSILQTNEYESAGY